MPSFDLQGKLILKRPDTLSSNGARLDFSTEFGDLIEFIHQDLHIAELLEKHKYVHYIDPLNLLDKICDPFSLGFLKSKENLNCKTVEKIIPCSEKEQNTFFEV